MKQLQTLLWGCHLAPATNIWVISPPFNCDTYVICQHIIWFDSLCASPSFIGRAIFFDWLAVTVVTLLRRRMHPVRTVTCPTWFAYQSKTTKLWTALARNVKTWLNTGHSVHSLHVLHPPSTDICCWRRQKCHPRRPLGSCLHPRRSLSSLREALPEPFRCPFSFRLCVGVSASATSTVCRSIYQVKDLMCRR